MDGAVHVSSYKSVWSKRICIFLGSCGNNVLYFRMRLKMLLCATTLVIFFTVFVETRHAVALDTPVFPSFTSHIMKQVSIDKQAFVKASTCLSWFYHELKKPKPPVVEGVAWRPASSVALEHDCPTLYPGGMNEARDDFTKTQTLLSVSMTVYEFALVADYNDDQTYSTAELHDVFLALSLNYDEAESPSTSAEKLTSQFDRWYRSKSLEEVMKGMSHLYERGYRVTVRDRAELDEVMR